MAHILCFTRNRRTAVEEIDEQTMRSACRLQDTQSDMLAEITVRLPDLEIIDTAYEVKRTHLEGCIKDQTQALQKLKGVRVGPGMLKIIEGLMEKDTDCKQLIFMVEECCHGIILALTKDVLLKAPKDPEDNKEYYANMVRKNIRLYNRCAAFGPGSALVEGIEPPEGDH